MLTRSGDVAWARRYFFFSSRRRHTRYALVTGVQTCALPISLIDLDAPPPPVSSPLVATLVERTLADLAEERRLAAALPGIGATNRPASQQVRAQYESHPYPRWQAPPKIGRAHV